jgi:hypothetical protein
LGGFEWFILKDIIEKRLFGAFLIYRLARLFEYARSNLTFFYTCSKKIFDKVLFFSGFCLITDNYPAMALTKKLIKILCPEIIFYYCTIVLYNRPKNVR